MYHRPNAAAGHHYALQNVRKHSRENIGYGNNVYCTRTLFEFECIIILRLDPSFTKATHLKSSYLILFKVYVQIIEAPPLNIPLHLPPSYPINIPYA